MTARAALAEGAGTLGGIARESPFLDAVLLLCLASGREKERLLASLPDELDAETLSRYRELLERRRSGEPVAYIVGRKEFYGRSFAVDGRVLVPRPDTELLVEASLSLLPPLAPGARPSCHDAFAGSGCVAITLAAERPDLDVSMSDASEAALALAKANSRAILGRELEARLGDVLSAAAAWADAAPRRGDAPDRVAGLSLITANPPYVPRGQARAIAAGGGEPIAALDGGLDGLSFYPRIVSEASRLLTDGGALAVEIGEEQGEAVARLFEDAGFERTAVAKDLAGLDRVVTGVCRAVRR